MSQKKKENEERLYSLEQATQESVNGYAKNLSEMKEKHSVDISRIELDQQEKIEADHNRQLELQAEMDEQGNKFE